MKQELIDLYEEYQKDTRFISLKQWDAIKKAHFVPGAGNDDEPLFVFVGEAPGRKENSRREPFVGPAGKVLDELLDYIELTREDVWISNVLKYQPKGNRDPEEHEVNNSRKYLMEEIDIVNPVYGVVALGRYAAQALLGSRFHSISKDHGKWVDETFISYHPASALYNNALFNTIKDDWLKLRECYD